MTSRLSLDLRAEAKYVSIHFCEKYEVEAIRDELSKADVAIFDLDAITIHSVPHLFRAFALVFKKPADWYGAKNMLQTGTLSMNTLMTYMIGSLQRATSS